MKVVIAPDKLRGTYTADEAAAALARGWRAVRPGDDLVELPLADGGEGTAAAILGARGGEWREAHVHDALGRPCTARFARLIDGSAALDVQNPLVGPSGAAVVFGPQKGASAAQVAELDERLRSLHLPTAERPGAGAGGGIGGMLMQLGARSVSGAALVTEEVGLVHALRDADLCVTAEGRIDRQTLSGKIVGHVADLCRASGVQCIAVGGIVEPAAAEELERRGCETHKQGDMERAGRELASRSSSPPF
jgi:glycerate kinase